MKETMAVFFIAFSSVAVAKMFGISEEAGLFGAILGVGVYLAGMK